MTAAGAKAATSKADHTSVITTSWAAGLGQDERPHGVDDVRYRLVGDERPQERGHSSRGDERTAQEGERKDEGHHQVLDRSATVHEERYREPTQESATENSPDCVELTQPHWMPVAWAAVRKLPNLFRIIFSHGLMPAAAQES